MGAPEPDPLEGFNREEALTEEHSFDELATGLAGGTLTRARALKLVGAALLGGVLNGAAFPGVAEAKRKKGKKRLRRRPAPIVSPTPTCPGDRNCGTGCCPDSAPQCCPPGPNGEGNYNCVPLNYTCCPDGVSACPNEAPICCSVQPQTKGEIRCCPQNLPVCIQNGLAIGTPCGGLA